MVVSSLTVVLRLHAPGSLKDKRSVVQSVKRRLVHRFNVAVAEVDGHEDPRSATLGFATVGRDGARATAELDKVERFLDGDVRFEVVDRERDSH